MMGKCRLITKLRDRSGESIVETLVAILIAALSCTILMTSVTAAVSINKNASEAQAEFEKELLEAEKQTGTVKSDVSINVKLITNGTSTGVVKSYDVLITGGDGKLTSFKLIPKEEND